MQPHRLARKCQQRGGEIFQFTYTISCLEIVLETDGESECVATMACCFDSANAVSLVLFDGSLDSFCEDFWRLDRRQAKCDLWCNRNFLKTRCTRTACTQSEIILENHKQCKTNVKEHVVHVKTRRTIFRSRSLEMRQLI